MMPSAELTGPKRERLMSYCRWSSMNWMCDVYVYEDVDGGWATHVAGRRRAIPPIPDLLAGPLSMALARVHP